MHQSLNQKTLYALDMVASDSQSGVYCLSGENMNWRIIMDLRRNIKEAITTGQMLEAVQLLTKRMIALVIIM